MAVIDKAVASWPFNNDLLDAIGSNNGTAVGTTFDGTTKKIGSHSLQLDAIDDRVTVGADSSIVSLTKGVWGAGLYVPSSLAGNTEYVFAGYGGDAIAQTHFTRISIVTDGTSSNYIVRFRNRAHTASNLISTNASFPTDAWRFIWIESTGTAYKIYVDNVDEAFTLGGGSNNGQWFGDISPGANAQVVWGASLVNGVYSRHFGSHMDAGFILNDATTSDDRDELWNDGDWIELGVEEVIIEGTKDGVPTIIHPRAMASKTAQTQCTTRIIQPPTGSKIIHRK